jgi:hypothetical protein
MGEHLQKCGQLFRFPNRFPRKGEKLWPVKMRQERFLAYPHYSVLYLEKRNSYQASDIDPVGYNGVYYRRTSS